MTRYIVETLPSVVRPASVSGRQNEWETLARVLDQSNCESVDEYCKIAKPTQGSGKKMKKLLRLALFDYSCNLSRHSDYHQFAHKLFQPDSCSLDDRFTVVNFNYDGLLGQILTLQIRVNCRNAKENVPPKDKLALISGGYYTAPPPLQPAEGHTRHPPNLFQASPTGEVCESVNIEGSEFAHHMPHGTFTISRDTGICPPNNLLSLQHVIYAMPDTLSPSEKAEYFVRTYDLEPMIHFPWEPESREPVHERQYEHSALSVKQAKRIHFIGLSGHRYLAESFAPIFALLTDKQDFLSKVWHVATTHDDRSAVFDKLLDCILPGTLRSDTDLRARLHANMTPHASFHAWLTASQDPVGD